MFWRRYQLTHALISYVAKGISQPCSIKQPNMWNRIMVRFIREEERWLIVQATVWAVCEASGSRPDSRPARVSECGHIRVEKFCLGEQMRLTAKVKAASVAMCRPAGARLVAEDLPW
jgi:hypothetical protein